MPTAPETSSYKKEVMEDPYKDSLSVDMANPQEVCSSSVSRGDGVGKLENEAAPLIPNETWNLASPAITKRSLSPLLTIQTTPVVAPTTESPGGVALKVATTVLQPICLGESPVVLPILAGTAAPQVGQTGTTPYLMTSQGPLSLPLVLEQQVLQHLNPQLLQQAITCPALSVQNNMLCQNPSLALGPPPALEQKAAGPVLDASLLTLLQNPSFAAILQDLFPGQGNTPPSCHAAASPPSDPFSPTFLPSSPLSHPYGSPLAPLVPPATLLVPYPVVIPLPVPLPIPIPIPVPVSACKDSKIDLAPPKHTCSSSKATQTSTQDIFPSVVMPSKEMAVPQAPPSSPSSLVVTDGEVLDLSLKAPHPQQLHAQEIHFQQDSVLDLSMPNERKTCIQSCSVYGSPMHERERVRISGEDVNNGALALGVLRPVDCTPKLDSKLLSGLASLEFSRQHKWVMDSGGNGSVGSVHDAALAGSGNIEIVSTSQTAKVIVSVKDAMPAIFCGKLKGLSGVSTKNFSIKCDASQGGYAALPRPQGEQHGDPSDTLKKIPKNRGIKLKKVSSQEIHILPIKKQRLAAFLPRK
ncbi:retinoic acid-induced protein 2 [Electrophorus electricus]|uniref:retinoic acid-induced protein 2 n=1 Tax=Electrophorus electricus TaxID=8005 RepID=UPI0015CFDC73|nr:retinoic acid-induced protein 2 [Electrophorus electricus]XP_035377638.1 retinoic acid-induced protein 2 [Electrophorus electricus]